jgi:hypothetical protein
MENLKFFVKTLNAVQPKWDVLANRRLGLLVKGHFKKIPEIALTLARLSLVTIALYFLVFYSRCTFFVKTLIRGLGIPAQLPRKYPLESVPSLNCKILMTVIAME